MGAGSSKTRRRKRERLRLYFGALPHVFVRSRDEVAMDSPLVRSVNESMKLDNRRKTRAHATIWPDCRKKHSETRRDTRNGLPLLGRWLYRRD